MINILCYGDSNTFGTIPGIGGRFPRNERWTGVLQKLLGPEYYVIEEGCGGRTTVIEDYLEPDKNGRAALPIALRSHRPLDLVIIMLGTNDMKHRFNMLPVDIAYGAAELGKIVEQYDYGAGFKVPKILLVCPIAIAEGVEDSIFSGFGAESPAVSRQLPKYFQKQAEAHNWLYLNGQNHAQPSARDKIHMDSDSHRALAEALGNIIKENFEK